MDLSDREVFSRRYEMSNTTFNLSAEGGAALFPTSGFSDPSPSPDSTSSMNLSDRKVISRLSEMSNTTFNMSAEGRAGGFSDPSPSPDSTSSMSNLSDGEADASPDIHMMESPAVDNTYDLNLNQTFIATPVNGTVNLWNENLSMMSGSATASDDYAVTSPDFMAESSCETSRRGSTENDGCSLSSREMMMNSFCQEDQTHSLVSSLEEASLPAELNPLSTTLDKSTLAEENADLPRFGTTFIQAELPTEEASNSNSNSLLALPSESEGGLLMTFVCEPSPIEDCGEVFTPGKTFVSHLSAAHADKDVHTSTPVQNLDNLSLSLPSFSVSPCSEGAGSPGRHAARQRQNSLTANSRTAPPPSTSKDKKFPKTDFSSTKSKVVTKSMHQPRVAAIRVIPAKSRSGVAANDAPRRATAAANLGVTIMQPARASPPADKRKSAGQSSNAASEPEQPTSSQVADAAAQHPGSQSLPSSSSSSDKKSPARSGQTGPEPTPKKGVLSKIQVRPGSAAAARPRNDRLSLSSRTPQEKRTTLRLTTSFSTPKADAHPLHKRPGTLNCSETASRSSEKSTREVKRISLVESGKSWSAGASWDESRSRIQGRPSPRRSRGAPAAPVPAPSPRPATPSTRPRPAWGARDEGRNSKPAGTPQRSSTGGQRCQATAESPLGGIKPQLNGSQTHTSMGPPLTSTRLPRKAPGPSRTSIHTEQGGSAQVSGGASTKPSSFRIVQKTRLTTTPSKNTGPPLATACKPAAGKGTATPTAGPQKRTASARLPLTPRGPEMLWSPKFSLSNIHVRLTAKGLLRNLQLLSGCRKNTVVFHAVDKNTPKAQTPQTPRANQRHGAPDVASDAGRKEPSVQQLRGLLTAGSRRFEAFAVVLQRALAERDEAKKQCRDLAQELVHLRGELVSSVHSSERLEKEKDELRVALEEALHRLQEQHKKELEELEQRLQVFYQAEWDKIHLTYQEETDKCNALMQQQMGELKANHEAMTLELESSHAEQLQSVKQQYETSLEELSRVHREELQSLDNTLKETGDALTVKIEELAAENRELLAKLTEEENRRKRLAGKSQKDAHTLYLEQELESLKVVLDIKNKQLHQQEKKLMEVDRLTEKNVKLDELLKKVQQANEDLKARMEKHNALSRQLSTEQAVLQESLQKESKVNKRLSMENEELMWKLHNGDLSSPRKASPTSTSPSRSFSLQSPRGSAVISSPPLSPR